MSDRPIAEYVRRNDDDLPATTYIIMFDEVPIVAGNVDEAEPFAADWVRKRDEQAAATWQPREIPFRHAEALIRRQLWRWCERDSTFLRVVGLKNDDGAWLLESAERFDAFFQVVCTLLHDQVSIVPFAEICRRYVELAREGTNREAQIVALRSVADVRWRLPGNESGAKFLALSAEIEERTRAGLVPHADAHVLALTPEHTQEILAAIRTETGQPGDPIDAIVVSDPLLRPYVQALTALEFPQLAVIAAPELLEPLAGRIVATAQL